MASTTAVPLSTGFASQEFPCVSRVRGHDSAHVVAWQASGFGLSHTSLRAALVKADGTLLRQIDVPTEKHRSAALPKVAGADGRYAVTYLSSPAAVFDPESQAPEVRARRLAGVPGTRFLETVHPEQRVAEAGAYSFGTPGVRPISYDPRTRSHFSVAYVHEGRELHVARLGYLGNVVSDEMAYRQHLQQVHHVSICDDPHGQNASVAWPVRTTRSQQIVLLGKHTFPELVTGSFMLPGANHTGVIGARNAQAPPCALGGSEFFQVTLEQGLANAPSMLLLAARPAPGPIAEQTGLLLDPVAHTLAFFGPSDSQGRATAALPLPAFQSAGVLYWQWVQWAQDGSARTTPMLYTQAE